MKLNYLNLGCGKRFHKDWINIDFVSDNENVIAHNLLNGIPYKDNTFDVVYHSHVLEHFNKTDGIFFISECFRVLKPGGIIRIAVPDLEMIVRNYLNELEKAVTKNVASPNYDWMMLELYDQVVRNRSGGYMSEYLQQPSIPNAEFVFSRLGEEARLIRQNFERSSKSSHIKMPDFKPSKLRFFNPLYYLRKIKNLFEKSEDPKTNNFIEIGKFRLGGEIHQWMYDRYSLNLLLNSVGFVEARKVSAFESRIPNWNNFELEAKNTLVYKPDSLFFEASKPIP